MCVWFRSAGQKKGKRRGTGGRRSRDPCGGVQDGWMAASHAKERKEGRGDWIEERESKMRAENEQNANETYFLLLGNWSTLLP